MVGYDLLYLITLKNLEIHMTLLNDFASARYVLGWGF